ncbi:hypothetical protein [Prosthecomicrobium sp. N25]|uniref:hypothetical protein n=1 Tax=Prosthecomicrobium sp. N25 TaxID=3129254 RepID=UPI0030781DB4
MGDMTDLMMPALAEIKALLLDQREQTGQLKGNIQVAFGQLGLDTADIEMIRGELKAMDARVRRLEP